MSIVISIFGLVLVVVVVLVVGLVLVVVVLVTVSKPSAYLVLYYQNVPVQNVVETCGEEWRACHSSKEVNNDYNLEDQHQQ